MSLYIWLFLIGVIAGLRAMTAPAVVSWAGRLGWLHLEKTPLGFLGFSATPYILTVLAIGELIADKLPNAQSRKAPLGFCGRIMTGGLSGAAIGMANQSLLAGIVLGVLGAIVGTLAGYQVRVQSVKAIGGKDLPIALLEDLIAVGGAFFIVSRFTT